MATADTYAGAIAAQALAKTQGNLIQKYKQQQSKKRELLELAEEFNRTAATIYAGYSNWYGGISSADMLTLADSLYDKAALLIA